MPQASDELRAEWIDDQRAISFLRSRGYMLSPVTWCWHLSKQSHKPTAKEIRAINYLIDEWDFGGLA